MLMSQGYLLITLWPFQPIANQFFCQPLSFINHIWWKCLTKSANSCYKCRCAWPSRCDTVRLISTSWQNFRSVIKRYPRLINIPYLTRLWLDVHRRIYCGNPESGVSPFPVCLIYALWWKSAKVADTHFVLE
jgi:hypothetical protein